MTEQVLITSLSNPSVKRFRALSTRRRVRYRDQLFVAEGWRTIMTLLEHGSMPVEFFYGESADPAPIAEISSTGFAGQAKHSYATDSILSHISDTVTSQHVCAVFKMDRQVLPSDCSFVLVIDGVRDPGNFGSIIRTAVAAGVDAMVTMPGSVDPYSPKVVRASAGLVESLPVAAIKTLGELTSNCFLQKPRIALADARSAVSYSTVDWTQPTILIIGNEAHGPDEQSTISADITVSIPMSRSAESINVAAATAILLFEANRQKTLEK